MPELPDVEIFRRIAEKSSGCMIKKVRISRNRMFKVSDRSLRSHLEGNRFIKTERHGKYLFIGLESGKWLVVHFGMTGNIYNTDKDTNENILVINFEEGGKLILTSTRKLGRIDLTESVEEFVSNLKLGPDAMKIEKNKFKKILASSRGMVKSALMNQNKIAGIGNIYADEILYHSEVFPGRKTKNTSDAILGKMHDNMISIFNTAIKNNAVPGNFPGHYLIHRRKEGERCPGGKIKKIKISGRPTYYCPGVQM